MANQFIKLIVLFSCISFIYAQKHIPDEIIERLIIRNINITRQILEDYAVKNNGHYPQNIKEFIRNLPTSFKNPVDSTFEAITDRDSNIPAVVIYRFCEPNGYELMANNTKGERLPYSFKEKTVAGIKGTAVPVWCYFPKNGTQSPTGEPNWYYYWSQTSASTGEHIYDPTIGTPIMGEYH